MKLTDSTPDMDAAGDSSTALSPGARPEVLLGPEHEQRRRTVEAALFGGVAEAVSFGRYRLLHLLGQGGMGSVYAAYDDHLDRKIALKLIRASRLDDAELRARTVREARALARLSHPNVVHVYEVGEIEGQLFVAMEFLAGPTLRTWLDGQERPWRETLAVLRQAGEGLAAAHAQGVVHRDFKPKSRLASQVVENTQVPRLRRWYVPILYQAARPRQDRAVRSAWVMLRDHARVSPESGPTKESSRHERLDYITSTSKPRHEAPQDLSAALWRAVTHR